jgi:hypothetical protein
MTSSPFFRPTVMPTYTFANAITGLDVPLVPGGFRSRDPDAIELAVQFIRKLHPQL